MVTGQVSPDREAVVSLRLRGASGAEVEVQAVLDTGFTDALTLPQDLIVRLQLPFREIAYFELADGTVTLVSVYRGAVVWHGGEQAALVLSLDGMPLLGMGLLYGSRVTLEVVDGGRVKIEALP
jgi:clan AA aspartic protease